MSLLTSAATNPKLGTQNPKLHAKLFLFDLVEDAFQGVQRLVSRGGRAEGLAQVDDRVLDVADALREGGARGVGMAAALQAFSGFQGFAIATPEAGDDQAVCAAEQ